MSLPPRQRFKRPPIRSAPQAEGLWGEDPRTEESKDRLIVDETEALRAQAKQARVPTSKILGLALPHKPRIGPQFQADIPALLPQQAARAQTASPPAAPAGTLPGPAPGPAPAAAPPSGD